MSVESTEMINNRIDQGSYQDILQIQALNKVLNYLRELSRLNLPPNSVEVTRFGNNGVYSYNVEFLKYFNGDEVGATDRANIYLANAMKSSYDLLTLPKTLSLIQDLLCDKVLYLSMRKSNLSDYNELVRSNTECGIQELNYLEEYVSYALLILQDDLEIFDRKFTIKGLLNLKNLRGVKTRTTVIDFNKLIIHIINTAELEIRRLEKKSPKLCPFIIALAVMIILNTNPLKDALLVNRINKLDLITYINNLKIEFSDSFNN